MTIFKSKMLRTKQWSIWKAIQKIKYSAELDSPSSNDQSTKLWGNDEEISSSSIRFSWLEENFQCYLLEKPKCSNTFELENGLEFDGMHGVIFSTFSSQCLSAMARNRSKRNESHQMETHISQLITPLREACQSKPLLIFLNGSKSKLSCRQCQKNYGEFLPRAKSGRQAQEHAKSAPRITWRSRQILEFFLHPITTSTPQPVSPPPPAAYLRIPPRRPIILGFTTAPPRPSAH
jgi:hypothetical protein